MTRTHRTVAAAGLAGLLAAAAVVVGGQPALAAPADETLAQQLTTLREEERMARDLYTALDAHYDGDTRPFNHLVRAEQKHFDSLGDLLVTYGVADPSEGRAAGSYAVPAIQEAYDRLLAQGKTSLEEAYQAGITLEKADLADLEEALAQVSQADVDALLERLKAGSQRHLAAFERAAGGGLPDASGRPDRPRRGHAREEFTDGQQQERPTMPGHPRQGAGGKHGSGPRR